MILELIVTALLLGWVLKGRFMRLADAPIKYGWMIFVPLGLEVSAIVLNNSHAVPFSSPLLGVTHVLGRVTWCVFVIANFHIPGAKLIMAGLVVNIVAMVANGGTMPVSYDGILAAYGKQGTEHWIKVFPYVKDMLIGPATRLKFLCDLIPVPRPFSTGCVYSIGDVISSIGGFIAIVALMRMPSHSEPKPAQGAA